MSNVFSESHLCLMPILLSACKTAANGEAGQDGEAATVAPPTKKKQRVREKGEKKLKRKIKVEKMEVPEVGDVALTLQPATANLDVHSDLLTHRDDDGVPDFPLPE